MFLVIHNIPWWILIAAFSTAFIIQIIYYIVFYSKVIKSDLKQNYKTDSDIPVSVIIAARNEADNLENHLPKILNQNYRNYEVIVIDDRSDDGTALLLKRMCEKEHKLRYIRLEESDCEFPGKKNALTKGIEIAQNDCLLFTDADCVPASDMWIAYMVNKYDNANTIVLGYGGYAKEETYVNPFVRYDTAFIAMQYGGFALGGFPYMGVGRNIMYSKKLWETAGGFQEHLNIASGDDDLFVQSQINKVDFKLQFHNDAKTISITPKTFNEWKNQKIRHYTTSVKYSISSKALLLLEPLSRVTLFISFLIAIFYFQPTSLVIVLIAYLIRLIAIYFVFGMFLKRMQEKGLIKFLVLFDFIFPCVQTYFYLCGLLGPKNTNWK